MTDSGEVIVHVFGRTDVGRTREHNEDAFVVADLSTSRATLQPEVRTHVCGPRGSLFMVADGMGGAAAGEIASAMAIETVLRELEECWSGSDKTGAEEFASCIRAATAKTNEEIHAFALKHPEYRGMGTTATIAGLLGDTLYLAQVGDSRGYLVRGGVAQQITKDQSLIQKLIEAGELTEEEAAVSDRRNIILQALGPEATVRVDLTHQQVRRGDVLVLCSDGLSGQVSKEQIAAVVTANDDLVTTCKTLIDLANDAGGPDNITVIAARFEGAGLSDAASEDHVGHRVYNGSGRAVAKTMELSAIADDDITAEVPASRATVPTPVPEVTVEDVPGMHFDAAAFPAESMITRNSPMASAPIETPVTAEEPIAAEERRAKGRSIAMGLLALFIVAAAWYVLHTARKVVPDRDDAASPASSTPAPKK